MFDAARQRAETLRVLRLSTDTDREQRTAMKRIVERNDPVLFRAEVRTGPATCKLECRFVGLATGVAEEHALGKRQFGQPLCERSEEHTSELQSLMRTSYAVFCLKK